MPEFNSILLFTIDDRRYAVRLSTVERVIRAVEITGIPKAPDVVLGVINVQGTVVPVVNVRRRFGLTERPITLSDHLIIVRTARRMVAMVVDEVAGLMEVPGGKITSAGSILPEAKYIEGVARLEEGLILIHDLEKFLSIAEERTLEMAMTEG